MATRWIEDASIPAPDGHYWARPEPDDCPHCPCHTARVCAKGDWMHATEPTYPDGSPYTKPCPCRTKVESGS